MDEGFDADTLWWKDTFREVDEIVTHFIVTYNEEPSIFSIIYVM